MCGDDEHADCREVRVGPTSAEYTEGTKQKADFSWLNALGEEAVSPAKRRQVRNDTYPVGFWIFKIQPGEQQEAQGAPKKREGEVTLPQVLAAKTEEKVVQLRFC